jgi:hypothetical protein
LTVLAELPRNSSGKVRETELRIRLAPVVGGTGLDTLR